MATCMRVRDDVATCMRSDEGMRGEDVRRVLHDVANADVANDDVACADVACADVAGADVDGGGRLSAAEEAESMASPS